MKWAVLFVVVSGCPIGFENSEICSGHGHCSTRTETRRHPDFLQEECVCDEGFTGGDCSQRVCPAGIAWFDYATGNQTAHRDLFECSNNGFCDRQDGICECRKGFEGHACERMRCPWHLDLVSRARECSGRGKCLSMSEAATQVDFISLFRDASYDFWDAEKIYGCACDEGFTGHDCFQRICPKGHDPMVAGALDEVQVIDCRCSSAGGCNGSLALTFRGQRTDPIPADAAPALVKYYLEQLSTVTEVEVVYVGGGPMLSLCSGGPGTAATVTFLLDRGDIPAMNLTTANLVGGLEVAVRTNGEASSLYAGTVSQRGTKVNVECSARGTCDDESGACTCYRGFEMSDGRNGRGHRVADCGFFAANASDFFYSYLDHRAGEIDGPCPRAAPLWADVGKLVCSGAGFCQPDKTCNCTLGYEGPACEYAVCPSGRAWWDEAFGNDNFAHQEASCSNRGACDRATGLCLCDESYELVGGPACNQMQCFRNVSVAAICGEHGTCASMRELASLALVLEPTTGRKLTVNYSEPWDADMVHGCACTPSAGLWRTEIGDASFRGPFAYTFTEFTGYSCGHSSCPTGDNPFTDGLNEVQTMNCTATRGSFTVTFRGAPPVEVPFASTPEKFELILESLPTLREVRVRIATNETWLEQNNFVSVDVAAQDNHLRNQSICSKFGQQLTVEFVSEHGDVPLLYIDASHLDQPVNITETTKGTKEDVECAGTGICNSEIGQCSCLDGFYSGSDKDPSPTTGFPGAPGQLGSPGQRGDCSFRHTGTSKDERWWNNFYVYEYEFKLPEIQEKEEKEKK